MQVYNKENIVWISTISESLYKKHYGDAIRTWYNLPGRKIMLFDGAFPSDIPFVELVDYWKVIDKNNSWFSKKQSKKIVRLSYKAWVIHWAIKNVNCNRLVWIDADMGVHKPVPEDLVDNSDNLWSSLKFNRTAGAPLDTNINAVETGLQIFNMNHPDIQKYADDYIDYYNSGKVYNLYRAYDNWVSSDIINYYPIDNLVLDPDVIRDVGDDTMLHTRFSGYMTHYLGKGTKEKIPKS
jgi:hypothetical protein